MGCDLLAAIGSFALLLLGIATMTFIIVVLYNSYEKYEERKDLLNRTLAQVGPLRDKLCKYKLDLEKSQDKIEELGLAIRVLEVDLDNRICFLEKKKKK